MAFAARFNRGVKQSACCDTNPERAQVFTHTNGIPQVFTDYAVMLEQASLDAVYLEVPHHLHGA